MSRFFRTIFSFTPLIAALLLLSPGKPEGGEGATRYSLNLPLPHLQSKAVNCYVPKYQSISEEAVTLYSELFGIKENRIEDDDNISFSQDGRRLTVNKYLCRLEYEVESAIQGVSQPAISDTEAIKKAVDFFRSVFLPCDYEEAKALTNDDGFFITFINRIDGLKNYAFPNTVRLDRTGNILYLEYYYFEYAKLGSCRVKTSENAYKELPADAGEPFIDVDGCELVYVFENSIIQPAYLFDGGSGDEKSFECFIKAAIY